MGVSSQQALSIVVIIYFFPAIFVTASICRCHGFGKQLGWLYMALLCIARVVGSSLQIASEISHDSNLRSAVSVVSSVGITALLLALLEIIDRYEAMLPFKHIDRRAWSFIHLTQYAAFILYAVGLGMGRVDLTRAASILVAVVRKLAGDKRLLRFAVASIPFLTVRVAYGLSTSFIASDTVFMKGLTHVLATAFLQYLMEFIVTTIFLYAGVFFLHLRKVATSDPGIGLVDCNDLEGNYSQMPPSR
ncbi:hypothetical protein P170DRAFT_425210 [Aspergillus steynii IBT 23096]|uniref:DUF7702 domain-containing protein n=1 Tax=Aspergillus steynii IBT 23096 TaxID=1392250 RepID=A0A2I2GDN0_9EURO|nr:uncharacterized protein P170DRAFT_425210 [Aspergillus steynii IBT 23096]PLB50917.1 hypothetical protein P170DRAFT_425210 [Aspergillus steynii IBT 23096]